MDLPVRVHPMTRGLTNSLQATGATPSVLDGEGDSLLFRFVVASLPAPVPELGRHYVYVLITRQMVRRDCGVLLATLDGCHCNLYRQFTGNGWPQL